MKCLFTIFAMFIATLSVSQKIDSGAARKPVNAPTQPGKPEIFSSGFIDIINNGQVNASARFVRLFIGEPGKFAIPLSLYSGVSANNFQAPPSSQSRTNEGLVTNFINPMSGLANISFDGPVYFKKTNKLTKSGFLYHFGGRVLSGKKIGPVGDPSTGKPINFFNSFGSGGLYFQTGAWEKSNAKNLGVCWFAARYIWCYSSPSQLRELMPNFESNGIYHGYSLAWGVEINTLVNIKVVFYKYMKKPEIDYYLPIYQFSFNYTMKK